MATKTQVLDKYGATRHKSKKAGQTGGVTSNNINDEDRGF